MHRFPNLWQVFIRHCVVAMPFLVLGIYFELLLESLFVLIALLLVYHYFYLFVLNNWLWNKKGIYPPNAKGLWGTIFDGIYSQQRRHANKRNELSNLVRRFRIGAEALPDAVVIYDDHRHIIWCNSLAEKMLGLLWPSDKGNRIDNLIRVPEFIEYLDNKAYQLPFRLPSQNQEQKVIEFRIVPFEDDKWTLIARDITKISQLEQMRKDFIANVSHELKTPLTVMRGYLEMVEDISQVSEPMWEQAQSILLEQTTRMDDLVDQLLSLSKIENQTESKEPELINIPKMLKLLLIEANSLSNMQHTLELKAKEGLFITGLESELRSAFSNLIFNAVRYTPSGGLITIEWRRTSSGAAKFSVKDSGLGIEPEHIPRLTERFYRVDEARTRTSGGAGLGLSIVKHVLAHHESKLEISSKMGKGSQFSFRFPKHLVTMKTMESTEHNNDIKE